MAPVPDQSFNVPRAGLQRVHLKHAILTEVRRLSRRDVNKFPCQRGNPVGPVPTDSSIIFDANLYSPRWTYFVSECTPDEMLGTISQSRETRGKVQLTGDGKDAVKIDPFGGDDAVEKRNSQSDDGE